MDQDEFVHYVAILQMLKIVYDKTGYLIYGTTQLCNEIEYDVFQEALSRCTNHVAIYSDEDYEHTKWIFYDDTMTEYYRLCEEYGRRKKLGLEKNPFVLKAKSAVKQIMNGIPDYSYDWHIDTDTRHKYASNLRFYQGYEFYQTCRAAAAIYEVFDYYAEATQELKKVIKTEKLLTVCKPKKKKATTERKAA